MPSAKSAANATVNACTTPPSSCSAQTGGSGGSACGRVNGLARYSINNQLLIAVAMPDASYVCGFRAWLGLGYQVRKGEKAIRIMAPMPIKTDTPQRPGC